MISKPDRSTIFDINREELTSQAIEAIRRATPTGDPLPVLRAANDVTFHLAQQQDHFLGGAQRWAFDCVDLADEVLPRDELSAGALRALARTLEDGAAGGRKGAPCGYAEWVRGAASATVRWVSKLALSVEVTPADVASDFVARLRTLAFDDKLQRTKNDAARRALAVSLVGEFVSTAEEWTTPSKSAVA
jgi:hypothetical protein